MYLFTPDELDNMTSDELTAIIEAAKALAAGWYWDGSTPLRCETPTEALTRRQFDAAWEVFHEARRKVIARETISAQAKLVKDLDWQLLQASSKLEQMREAYRLECLEDLGKQLVLINCHIRTVGPKPHLLQQRKRLETQCHTLKFEF